MDESPWFDEKSEQVTVSGFHAFGIRLDSRYGVARELAELLLFADLAATSGANLHVDHVFYNSKTCCCEFELRSGVDYHSPEGQKVFTAAMQTLSQFDWAGHVFHGKDAPDEEFPA